MKYNFVIETLDMSNGFGKILSQVEPRSTVLECGCATGYMTRYMKEKLSCDVYIIEIEQEAFDIAKQYAKDGICADLTQNEWVEKFQDMKFDYILFTDVLEHLTAPKETLKKAVRFLKPTGKMLISLPNVAHNDILMKLYDNHWDYQDRGLLDDTHIHFWAYNNIAEFFRDTGLKVTVVDATLLETFRTEQYANAERRVSPSFYSMLKHRLNGEVYQYILTAQLEEEVEKQHIETRFILPDSTAPELVPLEGLKTYDDLQAEVQSRESEIATLIEEKNTLISRTQELAGINENKDMELKAQAEKIDELSAGNLEKEQNITWLIQQNDTLLAMEKHLCQENENKDQVIKAQEERNAELANQNLEKEQAIEKKDQVIKAWEKQHTELIHQNLENQQAIEKLARENEALSASVSRLSADKRRLEKEKEVLLGEKNNLSDACKDLSKHEGELEHELRVATSSLKHIYDSDMYRFSLKYYKVRDKMFPPDSRRVAFIKRIVQSAKNRFSKQKTVETGENQAVRKNQIDTFFDYGEFTQMGIVTTWHTMYVAKLIEKELNRLSIEAIITVGEPETYLDIPYVIICPQFVNNFPPVYIAFQMEQTVSSRWFNQDYFVKLQNSCAIFDYSLENVEFFHKREYRDITSRVYYLPIDYCADFTAPREASKKEYDVLFYGDEKSCQRRRDILDELSKHFKVKICSEVFGDDVYREIQKAKVLVNIHYYEGALLETTRLYETLSLNTCVIVSEESKDLNEIERLKDFVDFVGIGNVEQMKERIAYWIKHDSERNEKIRKNKETLSSRPNAFSFFFQRFLLAYDRIHFDTFYQLVGNYVQLHTNKICLSLPESIQRRKSFDADNQYGFECFPGLRHLKGWVGCGLSYKMIFTKALEAGMKEIMICEDDVIFPADFESQLKKILAYLRRKKRWSVFSGIMADVGKVKILGYDKTSDFSILRIDHMISTVFNIYNKEMFKYFCDWDERDRDVYKNAIDRYLESKNLEVFIRVPFLVGHKEELNSSVWGFSNIEYTQMIQNSERKLLDMAAAYENEKKS